MDDKKTKLPIRKKWLWPLLSLLVITLLLLVLFNLFLGPPNRNATQSEVFVVGLKTSSEQVVESLSRQGFVKNPQVFGLLLSSRSDSVEPGGYRLKKSLNAWQVAKKVTAQPQLKWVVIPEGWRKEQIGEELARVLGWNSQQLKDWNNIYTAMKYDYLEGVYFPDTYLIPVDESGLEIADRFRARFEEKFAPYYDKFLQSNIKWTTALKIASLIQREAAGPHDMPLIAGIIWNRLSQDIKLEIDATLQYAKGKTNGQWWAPVKPVDKKIDSPYNTYLHQGLPPHPICNPGLAAIDAVLNPLQTDCLYYLHDADGQIHCALTYQEHLDNIDEHLK